jgi:hypothetical protein
MSQNRNRLGLNAARVKATPSWGLLGWAADLTPSRLER